jgi:hypothetical protein
MLIPAMLGGYWGPFSGTLVVLGGTPACLPLSPSPLANSFEIGTVVINSNAAKQVLCHVLIKHAPGSRVLTVC